MASIPIYLEEAPGQTQSKDGNIKIDDISCTLGKFYVQGKVSCQAGCGEGEHQAQGLKKESYVQNLLFVNEMQ